MTLAQVAAIREYALKQHEQHIPARPYEKCKHLSCRLLALLDRAGEDLADMIATAEILNEGYIALKQRAEQAEASAEGYRQRLSEERENHLLGLRQEVAKRQQAEAEVARLRDALKAKALYER